MNKHPITCICHECAPQAILPLSNDRMRTLLINVLYMLPAKAFNVPLWSIVSKMTGHGSTFSCRICRELGFDPNQIVRRYRNVSIRLQTL